MSSDNIKNGSEPTNKHLTFENKPPEENHSNYASACSSPTPNRYFTFEEPSNVSDIIPSIIAKTVVTRETVDYRDMGVEITSFAHPAKSHEYDQTVQYTQSDLTILSDSTATEAPSNIIDKGDVTHFIANVVEHKNMDEQVDYTKLRQLLKNQDNKGSSASSNILGNLTESSILVRNISEIEEKMENEIKEVKDVEKVEIEDDIYDIDDEIGKGIEQASKQFKLDPILQELDQLREENEQLKFHSDNLRKEVVQLKEENEHLKINSDNLLQELNQLREENRNLKFDSNADVQEIEHLREENKRFNSNSLEIEFIREQNERLKLELHAYKRNTRPSSSPSKDTKESKSTETRRNIFRDKLYFKLQLTKVDELEAETLADLVKEIMLILKIGDVNRVVPSLEQINKVMRLVPQLRDFIKTVILLVLNDNDDEINQDFSSRMQPQDIPPEYMLRTTIEVLTQWRETVKDMEHFASQLLQNSRRNTQQ